MRIVFPVRRGAMHAEILRRVEPFALARGAAYGFALFDQSTDAEGEDPPFGEELIIVVA
jgi:hypothetical protein